jgi:hypothetical protein
MGRVRVDMFRERAYQAGDDEAIIPRESSTDSGEGVRQSFAF